MAYKPDLSGMGAADSVNRVQHLRIGVGDKVIAPDGKESPSSVTLEIQTFSPWSQAGGEGRRSLQDAVQQVL